MGIDVHALNLLRFAAKLQPLGDVATLARQGLDVAPVRLRQLLGTREPLPPAERFCERLLVDRLGARSVESFDNSAYEGATHVVDLNRPITDAPSYDTVLDPGTSEHIFDIRQVLANVSRLCRAGGQILHVLPANNQNGHGFWQFSPELFFSLYSGTNGYRDTRVFLASDVWESHWFEVVQPPGVRVNVTSLTRTSVLVRTVRGETVSDEDVQQSDYVQLWADRDADEPSPPTRRVDGALRKMRQAMAVKSKLSRRHPNLKRIEVARLVS